MRAVALHQQGRLPEAQTQYQAALKAFPDLFDAANMLGVLLLQMRNPREAERRLARAVELSPGNAGAHNNHGNALNELNRLNDALAAYDRAIALNATFFQAFVNRGLCLMALKRPEMALASYEAAIALKPDLADAHDGRGNALVDLGRAEEAVGSYERAIALRPDYAEYHNNRAAALARLKRFAEALGGYDRALRLKPDFALAHDNRGVALAALDRGAEALASHDRAIALNPQLSSAHYNRGNLLRDLERPEEAVASFDRAIALNPNFAEAFNNRGGALAELRRWDIALASYERAVALNPNAAQSHYNRANALKELKRFEEAEAAYRRAVAINPDDADAHSGRGDALDALHRHAEAAKSYAQALRIDPDHPFTRGLLLHQKLLSCDWDGLDELIAGVAEDIAAGKSSAEPFCWQGIATSPLSLQLCARIFNAAKFPAHDASPLAPPKPGAKIRIGYVSGEFREQATAYLLAGVLEQHDRTRFEVYAFDNGWNDGGPTRARIEAAVSEIIDISRLDDSAAAAAIRERQIDILVNLNGYFGLQRMGLFARRPAPLQVNYLGFPGTLGAPYIDYIIADETLIPQEHQTFYDERIAYLPGSYQANDNRKAIDPAPVRRGEYGLPDDGFVFCSFNNSYKITPDVWDVWMRILKCAPNSVLWLSAADRAAVENLRREARQRDVEPGRLIFAEHQPLARHLARLRLADLFLDTLPCNAHTTASDALWAGLPLLTRMGETFSSRVAASLLKAIALPDLVAPSEAAYEALAVELANNREHLASIRERLAHNRLTTPLFDTEAYTRHLEAAYRTMQERFRSGASPETFHIEPGQ